MTKASSPKLPASPAKESSNKLADGIEWQRRFVEALLNGNISEEKKQEYARATRYSLLPGKWAEKTNPLDGNAPAEIREKYRALIKSDFGLRLASLRNLGLEPSEWAYNPSPINDDEIIAKRAFLEERGLAEKLTGPIDLTHITNGHHVSLGSNTALTHEGEKRLNNLFFQEPLKAPYIQFNIERLEFMVYAVESALAAAAAESTNNLKVLLPSDKNLERHLIMGDARETIKAARNEYPVLTS